MARHWSRRACSEGQVACAFAQLADALRGQAEPVVAALLARAADDERRHSQICAQLAGVYLGAELVAPAVEPIELPTFAEEDERGAALTLQVVGMCCIGETLATSWLTESLASSRTPLSRAANREHLAEEIDHARAGWAHLAAPRTAGHLVRVERHLLTLVRSGVSAWLAAADDLPTGTGLEEHGVLSHERHRDTILRGAREVVLPGFAELGLDAGPAQQWLKTL